MKNVKRRIKKKQKFSSMYFRMGILQLHAGKKDVFPDTAITRNASDYILSLLKENNRAN